MPGVSDVSMHWGASLVPDYNRQFGRKFDSSLSQPRTPLDQVGNVSMLCTFVISYGVDDPYDTFLQTYDWLSSIGRLSGPTHSSQ